MTHIFKFPFIVEKFPIQIPVWWEFHQWFVVSKQWFTVPLYGGSSSSLLQTLWMNFSFNSSPLTDPRRSLLFEICFKNSSPPRIGPLARSDTLAFVWHQIMHEPHSLWGGSLVFSTWEFCPSPHYVCKIVVLYMIQHFYMPGAHKRMSICQVDGTRNCYQSDVETTMENTWPLEPELNFQHWLHHSLSEQAMLSLYVNKLCKSFNISKVYSSLQENGEILALIFLICSPVALNFLLF